MERKREGYPSSAEDLIVEVRDPTNLSQTEIEALGARCRKANLAIYASRGGEVLDTDAIRRVAAQFGLRRLDENLYAGEEAVSALRVVPGGRQRDYIPYTSQALNWHTDGYYNPIEQRIRAFVMHCVRPAAQGGENSYLDHEMAFLLLHEANPDFVEALMTDGALTIPPNIEEGVELRPESTGPVFYVDEAIQRLGMRYTLRKRHVHWRTDVLTQAALSRLEALLTGDSPYVFRHRLEAGQGIICNNVLHSRCAFQDSAMEGEGRLLYRARSYDRIAHT
jgi:hypothetical protein